MKICGYTLLGAVFATFGLRAEFVDRSGLTQHGELEAYVNANGRTLTSGVYTVSHDLTITGDAADRNGLSLTGTNIVIDVASNATLTVKGTDAEGRTGAGAGIFTRDADLLMFTGSGKVAAYGGRAARGTAGGNGGSSALTPEGVRLGAGGKGGDGGGGAGAAIGTSGGEGGVGAAGAQPSVESIAFEELVSNFSRSAETVPNWQGKSPAASGGEGKYGPISWCQVLVGGQVNLSLMPGQTYTATNSCGRYGGSLFEKLPKLRTDLYAAVGAGGGGGGGGNGQGAFPCGQGGSGGAGGGGGGSGAVACGENGSFYPLAGGLSMRIDPANAPRGGGGSGGVPAGQTSEDRALSIYVKVATGMWNCFAGGSGGAAGETSGAYRKTEVMCGKDARVKATSGSLDVRDPSSGQWGMGKMEFTDPDQALPSLPIGLTVFYRAPYASIDPMTTTVGERIRGWKTADEGIEVFDRNGRPVLEKWPWLTGKALVPVVPSRHDRMLEISVNGKPIDDSTSEGSSGPGWQYDTNAGILHLTDKGREYRLSGTNEFGDVAVSVEANCTVSLDHLRIRALTKALDGVIALAPGVEVELKCGTEGNLLSAGDVEGLAGVCCPLGARLTVRGPTGLFKYIEQEDYCYGGGIWRYVEGLDHYTPNQLTVRGGSRAAAIGGVSGLASCGRLTFEDCIIGLENAGGANLLGCALGVTNRLTRAELRQCRPITVGLTVSMRIGKPSFPVIPAPHDPNGLPLYFHGDPYFIWLPSGRCSLPDLSQSVSVTHNTQ